MTRLTLALIFVAAIAFNEVFAEDAEHIIGGSDARPGQFPYQVSLRRNGRHFCGGTLITKRHVVTAAHCIHDIVHAPFKDFTVVTGSISITSGGQTHRVANAVYDSDYKPSADESYANDVAVVTLADSITVNNYQKPIPLASNDPPVGATLRVTGWGQTKTNGPLPNTLQTTTVQLLSNEECQKYFPQNHINGGQMCTFKQIGVGTCMGDSGGPLVFNGTLIGITSWVIPCAKGSPDAFTRVTHYKSFINHIVSYA